MKNAEELKCKRNKKQNWLGKKMRVICNKPAEFQQEDGLPLCKKHFKRWFEKVYGIKYSQFIKE